MLCIKLLHGSPKNACYLNLTIALVIDIMVTQIVHYYSALKTAFTLYWILRSRNVKSKSRSFLKVGRYSQIMLLITKHFINSQFLQQYVSVPIFLHPQKYKIFSILLIFAKNDKKKSDHFNSHFSKAGYFFWTIYISFFWQLCILIPSHFSTGIFILFLCTFMNSLDILSIVCCLWWW